MESFLFVFLLGVSVVVPYYLFGVLVRWPWWITRNAPTKGSDARRVKILRGCLVAGQFAIALAVFFGTSFLSPALFQVSKNLFFAVGLGVLAGGWVNGVLMPHVFGRLLIDPPRVLLEDPVTPFGTESELDAAKKEFRETVYKGFWGWAFVHVPIAIALAIVASSHFFGLTLLAFSLVAHAEWRLRRST